MFSAFEDYINSQIRVSSSELELICGKAIKQRIRRKHFLLQAGEVCRHKVFVLSGMLRMYSIKADGSEHIMQFSPENNWCTDPESLNDGIPSKYNIDALEDSEVLLWTKSDFSLLWEEIPQLRALTEKLITNNLHASRQRILTAISATAEEKYDDFIQTQADVFARVPLHMVASYLGVSRETLSRIRHAQVKG
ncbi:Crp/Fnr family transcriptional regulator [Mucilaginibacter mali]|uniref:Crp/Fnr family transcriptional regulator n=1 Tax=Mucilaginibacter mali TaxID=2740462 RepID=A0A7D4PTG5_9SPHI|nr:Crp/Fnr family transcriptional regulator [Mucilaginibacter mali]QKJ29968.1 Crp/Fnr family transcriptional regulator [Mucilaginibacter mali]